MPLVAGKVIVNLSGMDSYRRQVQADLDGSLQGPIRKAMKQWAVIYRSFVQERYDAFSKGGGDWPPLAKKTQERRRKGKGIKASKRAKGKKPQSTINTFYTSIKTPPPKLTKNGKRVGRPPKFTLLRDTNTMFAAVNPQFQGSPGAIEIDIPFGVLVGFGGPSRHPSSSQASIAEIAGFHQAGGPHLPKREIIVDPPDSILQLMAEVLERALNG